MTQKKADFLSLLDHSPSTLTALIQQGLAFKKKQLHHLRPSGAVNEKPLQGKRLGLIFKKSSTRTRIAFQVAMEELGGSVLSLSANESQLGRGESLLDTVGFLGRLTNVIAIRSTSFSALKEVAEKTSVPIVNALTEHNHPCQVIADFMLIEEKKQLAQAKIAYVGDWNNVALSLAHGAAQLGLELWIATPKGAEGDNGAEAAALLQTAPHPQNLHFTHRPEEAVKDAAVIYTDTWTSMGEEKNAAKEKRLAPFQVNRKLVRYAQPDFIFMHCLPAYRGKEVSDEIMASRHSVVFEQAENRVHSKKAILNFLLK